MDPLPPVSIQSKPDPSLADTALQAHNEMLGQIQSGLADVVDANLSANAAAQKKTQNILTRKATQADTHQSGLVNDAVAQLAATIGAQTAPNEVTVQTLGQAAVGMRPAVAPALLPVGPPVGLPTVPLAVPAGPNPVAPAAAPQPSGTAITLLAPIGSSDQLRQIASFVSGFRLFARCNGTPSWIVVPYSTLSGMVIPVVDLTGFTDTALNTTGVDDVSNIYGPNTTILTPTEAYNGWAALNCGVATTTPPPPPPPPPPPTITASGGNDTTTYTPPHPPDQTSCPVITSQPVPAPGCSSVAIPDILTVGSPAFCAAKNDLRTSFVQIGQWAIDLINSADIDGVLKGETSLTFTGAVTQPQNVVASLLFDALQGWFSDKTVNALNQMKGVVACWYGALKAANTCHITEVMALCLVRAAIEGLQRMRIGWDIGLWATVDLTMHIDPLVKVLDYLIADSCPAEIPSAGEAMEAYIHGRITEDLAKCWLSLRGCSWEVWHPIIVTRMRQITEEEYIQYGRRIGAEDTEIQDGLRHWGLLTEASRKAKMFVYDQLPSVSEVLQFLQRNVFDSQYVADYGLLEGYSERFYPRYGTGLRALGVTDQTMRDHYAAHWVMPSIGQLSEMMQRLRPGRVPIGIEFTPNDFNRLLAEQDIAPWFRKKLEAIAYRTIPLRQLNQAAQQGRFDHDELQARWQDIGFNAMDAGTLADTTLVTAARQLASAGKGYTAGLVADLAEYGLITKVDANSYLNPQGFNAAAVDQLFQAAGAKAELARRKKHDEGTVNAYAALALQAYEDGTVDAANATQALSNAGYSPDAASLAISTIDLRVRKATVDLAVTTIHKAYRFGAVDANGALNALIIAGVVQPMATTYVNRWQLEMSVPRVAASTAAVLRWTKKGIMSVPQAAIRLANLGWSSGDINLQLLEIEQEINQANSLAASKKAKQLAQAQKAAQSALKATQRESCKIFSPSKMLRWYALRIIDDTEFKRRLTQCGYDATGIGDLFKEAEVARAAADLKAKKKGPAGIEYTGQGAITGNGPT